MNTEAVDGLPLNTDREHRERGWTDVEVDCDDGCAAVEMPVTLEELLAAYEHWKYHGYLSGCSHGS